MCMCCCQQCGSTTPRGRHGGSQHMQCVVGPNTLAATLQHQPQPPKDSPPAAAAACLAAAPAAAACHAFTTCAAWLRPVLLLACAGGVLCSAPRMAQLPGASWSSSDPYTLITHPGVVQGDALPMWQASSSQPPTQGHPARYVAASKPRSSVSRHYCSMAAIWGPGMEPLPHKPTHGDQGWATGWQGMAVWCVCGLVPGRLSAQICQPPRLCQPPCLVCGTTAGQTLVKPRQQKWVLLVWHAQQSSQTGAIQGTPPHTQCCGGATGSPCADGMLKRQQQAAATLCTQSPLIHPRQGHPPTTSQPYCPSAYSPTPPRPASSTSGHRAR